MKTISPKDLNNLQLQTLLQTAIAPRPIALASTIDKDGNIFVGKGISLNRNKKTNGISFYMPTYN